MPIGRSLNKAQLSADSIVDQAEEHARDLMRVARAQQRQMLQQARESGSNRGSYVDPQLEDQRTEQLGAYSGLLRNRLQAMIMTLSVEVDKLALLPLPGASGAEDATEIGSPAMYPRDLPIGGAGHSGQN